MREQLFKPTNQLTFATVQVESNRLLSLLGDKKITSLRFNLNDVVQCDSAGLALLIEAQRLCKQHNKKLIIEGMSEEIYALAEFCGVQTICMNSSEGKE